MRPGVEKLKVTTTLRILQPHTCTYYYRIRSNHHLTMFLISKQLRTLAGITKCATYQCNARNSLAAETWNSTMPPRRQLNLTSNSSDTYWANGLELRLRSSSLTPLRWARSTSAEGERNPSLWFEWEWSSNSTSPPRVAWTGRKSSASAAEGSGGHGAGWAQART